MYGKPELKPFVLVRKALYALFGFGKLCNRTSLGQKSLWRGFKWMEVVKMNLHNTLQVSLPWGVICGITYKLANCCPWKVLGVVDTDSCVSIRTTIIVKAVRINQNWHCVNIVVLLLASSVRLSDTEAAVATPAQDKVTKPYPPNRCGRVDTRS